MIFQSPFHEWQSTVLISRLTGTAEMIEGFKRQSGVYPANLRDLNESPRYLLAYDDTQASRVSGGFVKQPTFYYQRLSVPPGYHLFSVGKDGRPFTMDDVLLPLNPDFPGLRHPLKR